MSLIVMGVVLGLYTICKCSTFMHKPVRVLCCQVSRGDLVTMMNTGKEYQLDEIGVLAPQKVAVSKAGCSHGILALLCSAWCPKVFCQLLIASHISMLHPYSVRQQKCPSLLSTYQALLQHLTTFVYSFTPTRLSPR